MNPCSTPNHQTSDHQDISIRACRVNRSSGAGTGLRQPDWSDAYGLSLEDSLRAPLAGELGQTLRRLLGRGERTLVLDLSRVSTIDAAGVGELVRAYNMTIAAHGLLRIVHATRWVREMLERARVFDLLSAG